MTGLRRRPDGANRDEPERTSARGSVGAGEEPRVASGGRGELARGELPAREAVVETVSGGRSERAEASQCRACKRARQAGGISPEGDETGAGEVWERRGRAVWANAGGRTFGERRRDADRRGDAAAVDVGGRAVEAAAQAETVSTAARAEASFWGVGTDGRKFSRLVGGARPGRMHDEHD